MSSTSILIKNLVHALVLEELYKTSLIMENTVVDGMNPSEKVPDPNRFEIGKKVDSIGKIDIYSTGAQDWGLTQYFYERNTNDVWHPVFIGKTLWQVGGRLDLKQPGVPAFPLLKEVRFAQGKQNYVPFMLDYALKYNWDDTGFYTYNDPSIRKWLQSRPSYHAFAVWPEKAENRFYPLTAVQSDTTYTYILVSKYMHDGLKNPGSENQAKQLTKPEQR